jgi:hypothetical protein
MYLLIWGCVAVLLFAGFSYSIGRGATPDDNDIGGIFFTAFVASFFWPIVLALLCVFGPFYALYKMGINKTKKEAEKEKIWNTLKQ